MPTHIPEPDQSPQGPRYEGRLLDRPEEEVVDQGVSFDMGTPQAEGTFGAGLAGAGTLALVACSTDSTTGGTATTPSTETAPPRTYRTEKSQTKPQDRIQAMGLTVPTY